MAISPEELDILHELGTRRDAEGPVFWVGDGDLALFDPELAQQIEALNFSDLTLPNTLTDLLRGRTSTPFSWKQVRAAWSAQLRQISSAEELEKLAERMSSLLDERLDHPRDLVWTIQEVCAQALVPVVMAGLGRSDTKRVLRDQHFKLSHLLVTETPPQTLKQKIGGILIQASAGLVARRELRGRATGSRPRQQDLTDALVDLLPELGVSRAVDAITGALTAVAGPPGAVAVCMLYELARRPEWAARLTNELEPISLRELSTGPTRLAPVTYRFVKEALRMWTPLSLLGRPVRNEIKLEQICLHVGHQYRLSPYLIHHDPRNWTEPDRFDPDRWLPESGSTQRSSACYVPFGWSPRTCVGANLGTSQLILLCHLLCTRYHVQLAKPEAVRMALATLPLPQNFNGTITRR